MNQIERRDAGLAYISDDSVFEEQKKCRQILQKLNFIDRSDFAGISYKFLYMQQYTRYI